MTFRMTARDGIAAGGGIGFAETKVTVATARRPVPGHLAGLPQVVFGTTTQNVTWDVAGTDLAPINTRRSRSRCRPTAA